MNYKSLFLSAIISMMAFVSCSDSDETQKSSEKELLSFKIENLICVIQDDTIKIQIDSDMSTVYSPTIEVSSKATVSPKSGTQLDFSDPVTFTVTAEDGSLKTYKTKLLVNKKLSSEKELFEFSVEGFSTKIKEGKVYISAYSWQSPYGLPAITVSEKATVSPNPTVSTNLSWINKITVTAEDGSTNEYPVVWSQADGISEIKVDFSYNGSSRMRYFGVFDENAKTITIDYERERNSTYTGALVIATRGEGTTTNPGSGVPLDEIPESISVTTKDGTVNYALRVRNINTYIHKIELPVIEGVGRWASNVYPKYREGLEDTDICIFVLENENLKNITPSSFTLSHGAVSSPLLTTPQDFSKDIVYTITSQSEAVRKVTVRTVPIKIFFTNEFNMDGSSTVLRLL